MIQRQFEKHAELPAIYGQNIFKRYEILSVLGSSHSLVLLGRDQQMREVAIKELVFYEYKQSGSIEEIKREITRFQQMQHSNIISHYESCILYHEVNQYTSLTIGYVCMEKALGHITEASVELIPQTLSALKYLEDNEFAHCDIKPENILICSKSPPVYKICDVGSCKNKSIVTSPIGTISYMSPEMLNSRVYDLYLSDVFSLGLVFLQMFKGRKYTITERKSLSIEEFSLDIQSQLSKDNISKLLRRMLHIDPANRYSFARLLLYWEQITFPPLAQSSLQPVPIRQASVEPKLSSPQRVRQASLYQSNLKKTVQFENRKIKSPLKSVNVIDFFQKPRIRLSPIVQRKKGIQDFQIKLLQ